MWLARNHSFPSFDDIFYIHWQEVPWQSVWRGSMWRRRSWDIPQSRHLRVLQQIWKYYLSRPLLSHLPIFHLRLHLNNQIRFWDNIGPVPKLWGLDKSLLVLFSLTAISQLLVTSLTRRIYGVNLIISICGHRQSDMNDWCDWGVEHNLQVVSLRSQASFYVHCRC